MSEKVLGFNKKDADFAKVCALCRESVPVDASDNIECESCGNCELGFIEVAIADMNKLVPVVSVEWLKKYRKKNQKLALEIKEKEFVGGYNTALNDLLSAVEKEAGKK